MRRFWWFLFLLILQVGVNLGFTLPADSSARWYRFTILHTNDTHGHLLPFSYPERLDPNLQESQLPFKRDIGGIARRATLVQQLRQQLHGELWLVDCGDFCDGTPFSLHYRGVADVVAMNACGYDYATLGNHEFNNTLQQVKKLIATARYPYVLANAREKATGRELCPPYRIVNRNGIRFALFGLVTDTTRTYPAAEEGVEILDPVEVARNLVAQLRREADVVILLSHLGIEVDRELAATVPGIDVIIGGHSHTRLAQPQFVEWRGKDGHNLGGTVIVQAHQWGGELGRVDLLFGRDPETGRWRLIAYKGSLLPVTASIPEDRAVAAAVKRFWKPIAKRYGEQVGYARDDFVQIGDDLPEYYLVGDAVRSEFKVEFDLQNLYGIRTPLAKGAITLYDLSRMMPFGNTVITFEITGRDLKALLQQYKPSVSGIRYRVEKGKLVEATINGQPIEEDRLYRGTTNSYFARRALKPLNIPYRDSGENILDVVARYLRKVKEVQPAYDGRRMVRP